jgi:hypothetical protein
MTRPGADLTLSGHTHGGQIALFGHGFFSSSIYGDRYRSGWYEDHGALMLVSNGLGGLFAPLRLGAPPQAHLITLYKSNRVPKNGDKRLAFRRPFGYHILYESSRQARLKRRVARYKPQFSGFVLDFPLAEQKRDAPQTRNSYQRINHAAEYGRLTAEQVGHQIERKQTHQQPVDGSDDDQNQRYTVQHGNSPLIAGIPAVLAGYYARKKKKNTARIQVIC